MKEVFISYSTIDGRQAETVRDVLENNGISCWMAPRDIPGGSNYTREIPIAIRGCKVFLLILSENAQNSHWVLKELDSAVNAGKVILPFMLEDCVLHDEFNFLLTGAQRYAAYQKKAEALENLIGRIRAITDVEQRAEFVPEAPAPVKKGAVELAVCPACGGSDVKENSKKTGRQGLELLTLLLIPGLAVAGSFLLMLITAMFLPWELMLLMMLVGGIGGGFLGNRISVNLVRRWRVRRHIRVQCYRCNSCGMKFSRSVEFNP